MEMVNEIVQGLSKITTSGKEVTKNIFLLEFTVVNAFIVSNSSKNKWILVDTGLENSADFIIESIEKSYGENSRPEAIVLTHGHFDHVGSVLKLSELWDVPVYAHTLELPYITGKKDYPVGDPTVDGGLIAEMSPTFPHRSINLGSRAKELPSNGTVPGMSGWKWIHTPGHTEGHISLFFESEGILIPGDAFTTVKQESLLSVITQKEQISGPPSYLTTDWKAAKNSIEVLKNLKPQLAIPSHGQPMEGEDLTRHLELLMKDFEEIAVPEHGVFV